MLTYNFVIVEVKLKITNLSLCLLNVLCYGNKTKSYNFAKDSTRSKVAATVI